MNRFFIDVFDAAGNKLGDGPTVSALGWDATRRMDRAGSFQFTMPGSDPKASVIAEKRRVICYASLDNAWEILGDGIIDQIETIPGADGVVMLSVSGQDSIYELAGFSAGYASIASGSRAVNVQSGLNILRNIAANTYGATWEFDYANTVTNPDVYALLQGESLLAAVSNVARSANYHFRSGGARTLTFFQGSTPSGIRAIRAHGDLAPETCAITNLRRTVETHDLFTRIVPFGAGQGHARLTLSPSTRETPVGYTVSKTALPTFIQKDDAVASYGRIDRWVEFKEIGPIANTDLDVEAAANALFDYAKIHLDLYSQRATHYTLEVAQCSQALLPGQSIRVDYRDALSGLIIEEDLFIIEATIRVNTDGVQTTSLVVSDQDRWPISDADVLGNALSEAKVYRSHPQLNANSYTTSYSKNIDDTETATIRFWFGNEVVQLQQVLLQFQLLQFESTVKAVALESTSGGSGELVTDEAGGGDTSTPSNNTSGSPSVADTGAATGNTGESSGNTSGPSSDTTGSAAGNTGSASGATGEPSTNTSGAPSNNTSSTPSVSDTGASIGSTGAASGNTDPPNNDTSGSPSVTDTGSASGNTGAPSTTSTGAPSTTNTGAPSSNNSGGPLSSITGLPLNSTGPSSSVIAQPATGNTGAASGNTGSPSVADTGAATGNTGDSGELDTGEPEGGDTETGGIHIHPNIIRDVGDPAAVPVYYSAVTGPGLVADIGTSSVLYNGNLGRGNHTHGIGGHTHSLASHSHTLNSHTHSLNNHTHSLNSHTHDLGDHTHNLSSHVHSMENHAHSLNNHSHSLNNHTHGLNNHTHSLNSHTHSLAGHRHSLASHTHGLNDHTHSLGGHTHSLNSHTHTLASHTHSLGSHTHSLAAHTHTLGNHTHSMGNHTHTLNSHVHSLGGHTHSLNNHTHSLNNHQHTITPVVVMNYGIFRQTLALTYTLADLEFRVNGGDFSPLASAAQNMGGGWYRLDITSRVQNSTSYRPLSETNTLQIRRSGSAGTGKTVTLDALLSVRSTIQAVSYSIS